MTGDGAGDGWHCGDSLHRTLGPASWEVPARCAGCGLTGWSHFRSAPVPDPSGGRSRGRSASVRPSFLAAPGADPASQRVGPRAETAGKTSRPLFVSQVSFDSTKHLSDASIKKRQLERQKLQELEQQREEQKRREKEAEERQRAEERWALRAALPGTERARLCSRVRACACSRVWLRLCVCTPVIIAVQRAVVCVHL